MLQRQRFKIKVVIDNPLIIGHAHRYIRLPFLDLYKNHKNYLPLLKKIELVGHYYEDTEDEDERVFPCINLDYAQLDIYFHYQHLQGNRDPFWSDVIGNVLEPSYHYRQPDYAHQNFSRQGNDGILSYDNLFYVEADIHLKTSPATTCISWLVFDIYYTKSTIDVNLISILNQYSEANYDAAERVETDQREASTNIEGLFNYYSSIKNLRGRGFG